LKRIQGKLAAQSFRKKRVRSYDTVSVTKNIALKSRSRPSDMCKPQSAEMVCSSQLQWFRLVLHLSASDIVCSCSEGDQIYSRFKKQLNWANYGRKTTRCSSELLSNNNKF